MGAKGSDAIIDSADVAFTGEDLRLIPGVPGLAAVVLVHEGVEVLVILNGLRASRSGLRPDREDRAAA